MPVIDSTLPRIAFCTTVKNRTQHLKITLPKNLADSASYPNAVFVVLDYDSPDDLIEYLYTEHAKDIASGRLVFYRYKNGGGPFEMAHAKNMAARCGILEGADILVTQDADNFTGVGFCEFIASAFRAPDALRKLFLCPNYVLIKSLPHGAARPPRGYAGRLALWTQTFIKAGGYDEMYNTWRGEDIDMNFRLQRMGYTMGYIDNGNLHAINHNAEVRFKEYPHAQRYENGNELGVIRSRTETVVNNGRFGVGTVRRNTDETAIELRSIPTRIFGIGMHRTATSSLHAALGMLGFDSLHWGTGEAPMIWYEMKAFGRSKTLEQFYALSDLPIPLLYQKLDKAYPGSKFILTVRNERDWLRSVERLWDYKFNPTRHLWEIYPFSHNIHAALYGQKEFDAQVFLERYRRHNEEVLQYFKDRPSDLLVLEVDLGMGWEELCQFLDRPVPTSGYPMKNQSIQTVTSYVLSPPADEECPWRNIGLNSENALKSVQEQEAPGGTLSTPTPVDPSVPVPPVPVIAIPWYKSPVQSSLHSQRWASGCI
jgi:hypothetical protein